MTRAENQMRRKYLAKERRMSARFVHLKIIGPVRL